MRNSLAKRLTLLLTVSLSILFVMPISSFAAESVKYLDKNGEEQTCKDYVNVAELEDRIGVSLSSSAGEEAWYYLDEDKTFNCRLTAVGNVHLIIKDGCTLNTEAGIRVVTGSDFYIYGQSTSEDKMGVIKADNSGNAEQSGIGGNDDESSGWVVINGCKIIAKGGKYGAGIGGGDNGEGFVEINGGIVEATGGEYGAGIGSGDEAVGDQAGSIYINGGTVKANGGYDGAGIGGGNETAGGDIKIKGGKIDKATGGYFGAGIGGGDEGDAGSILITGGDISADSGGVESSTSWFSSSVGGAGIGGGRHGNAGTIKISGGKTYAHGMCRAAAIGSGGDSHHEYTGEHDDCDGGYIEISGGEVKGYPRHYNAYSSGRIENSKYSHDGGAGIGSGADSYGVYVKITGGSISSDTSYYDYRTIGAYGEEFTATEESACIGNGYSTDSKGKVEIVNTDRNPELQVYLSERPFFGSSEDNDECDVIANIPYCQIKSLDPFPKEQRMEIIRNGWSIPVTIEACHHENMTYTYTESGHSLQCEYCDIDINNEAHEFEWLYDSTEHWQKCTVCGYETEKAAHEYDKETGLCECGAKGIKVEVGQTGGSGDQQILWASKSAKITLGEPQDYGFKASGGNTFRGWQINDDSTLYAPGEKVKIMAESTLTAVFDKTSWIDFKESVEMVKNQKITLDHDVILQGVDKLQADQDNELLQISIPEGHNVILDLNGHTINKNQGYNESREEEDAGIFMVGGSLTIMDSSEAGTGTVTGGFAAAEKRGGAVTVDNGTFNLKSGILSKNGSQDAGAVYVLQGTFNMTGGTIEENGGTKADAVYVGPDAKFVMSGGTITKNVAMSATGVPAVMAEDKDAVQLSGKVDISNNMCVSEEYSAFAMCDFLLKEGETVNIAGALDSESRIGVATEVQLEEGQKVQITSGGNATNADNFVSDNPDYQVVTESGEAYLTLKEVSDPDAVLSYTVNTSAKYGQVILDKTSDIKSGDVVNILAVPDEGYVFESWTVESSSGQVNLPAGGNTKESTSLSFGYKSEEDEEADNCEVTVTATFRKITPESISISLVDGTSTTPLAKDSCLQTSIGDTIQLSAEISPNGAEQDVIWESSDPDVEIDADGKVTVKGSAQLPEITAYSADKSVSASVYLSVAAQYVVTFDADGGEGANGEVLLGERQMVDEPEDPVREGDQFLGWKKVLEDGSLDSEYYNFNSVVESSFTLKAEWQHKNHTLEHVDAVEATCDQEGHEEYWACTVCGKAFSDAEGKNEVSLDSLITTKSHDWGPWTSISETKHERVCANDSAHVETEKHRWDTGVIISTPTIESDGETKYTCDCCGATKIVTVPKLEEDEHSINIETAVKGDADAIGGTVTGGKSKGKKGDTYKLKPKAHRGFEFLYWLINGNKYYDDQYNLEVNDSNITVLAVFGEIAVERMDIYDGGVLLNIGEKYSLPENIKIYPSDAIPPELIWESSDAKIATVDENGLVTAVAAGIAEITGKKSDGTEMVTCTVHVNIDSNQPSETDTSVGTRHKVKGNTYKVLSKGTVALVKAKNAKNVSVPATVKIGGKTFKVTQINAKAFTGKKIRKVTIGKNVKKIKKFAFKGSRATKLIVKTKKLKKAGVKKSLSGSKIRSIKVKVGKKAINKKYVKKYRKVFTKKIAGKKVVVK